ncbi:MAG: sigma-54 dependent transcriptional regulator [Deltaproteobacteria bacterium]
MMGKTPTKILLIEDNPADAGLVREMLADSFKEGYSDSAFAITNAVRLSTALKLLDKEPFDAILLDLYLPDSAGLETFGGVHMHSPDIPVVVLTGNKDETAGVKAVQEGAQDYLVKGSVDERLLAHSLTYAIERNRSLLALRARSGQRPLSGNAKAKGIEAFSGMVGLSDGFKSIASIISTVARTPRTSVMIVGETGVGKELIANAIHALSSRSKCPFIKLNCSAIPSTLLESEMFGYNKGAFTDARGDKMGLFELAHTGAIFLDEIGDMDLRIQPKLLQVLENRAFRRVGGTKEIPVDVRVIVATNRDLEAMVRGKTFREDLYHRLKVIVVNVPPLRDRQEDIIPLAGHFMDEACRSSGVHPKRLSKEARDAFLRYRWPGNIRELKNLIERLVILTDSDEIQPRHLPLEMTSEGVFSSSGAGAFMPLKTSLTIEEMNGDYIRHVLNKVNGNKTKASEILGISRITLRERLKKTQQK